MDEPKPAEEPKQSYEERRKALLDKANEDLDEFSRRGIVRPGALKAAKWVSRALWLGMTAMVVVLLWRLQETVPRASFDALKKERDQYFAEAKNANGQLESLNGVLLVEALQQNLLKNASELSKT